MDDKETPGDRAMEAFGLLSRYFDGEATVAEIAREAKKTPRQIWRQIKAHREKGVRGLSRAVRKDKGRRRKLNPKLVEATEGLYLRTPRPTIVWVHEQVIAFCKRDGLKEPSYTVVWEICKEIDQRLKVLAHEGDAAYEQIYDILVRKETERPNELWQGDHKEKDIWTIDELGCLGKAWLTGIVDDYSRAVPGYFIGVGPANSMRIASALRQAIWRKTDERWPLCGIPEVFYTDRGKDFRSTHIEQAAADLGMRLIRTKAKKPRGKGKIERFFRTVDQRFTSKIASSKENPIPIDKLRHQFHEWLMTDYHKRIHREIKSAPIEKWSAGNFLPRLPDSEERLELMLQKVGKPRKMTGEGIRFQNRRYSDMKLSGSVGEEFSIRYDPRDLSCIWVYAEEGKLLCKATCAELSGARVPPREIIAERMRVKNELKRKLQRYRTTADAFANQEDREQIFEREKVEGTKSTKRLRRYFHEREN
jgi:putative transposase